VRIVDANLLIYAFDGESPFHDQSRTWLEGIYREDDLVGLPPATLVAFARITTNPRAMRVAASPTQAIDSIKRLIEHPKSHVLECGPRHWDLFRTVVLRSGVFGPSMTDAHLATLAIEHGALLCSHDEGFRRYQGLRFENPLVTF
jgi:uncharacterized protein